MRRSSRLAAKPSGKGGLANALFVVADGSDLPCELDGLATEIRVAFPWASLLEGVLGRDRAILAGVARAARSDAIVRAWWSVVPRDGVGEPAFADVRRAWEEAGFAV